MKKFLFLTLLVGVFSVASLTSTYAESGSCGKSKGDCKKEKCEEKDKDCKKCKKKCDK